MGASEGWASRPSNDHVNRGQSPTTCPTSMPWPPSSAALPAEPRRAEAPRHVGPEAEEFLDIVKIARPFGLDRDPTDPWPGELRVGKLLDNASSSRGVDPALGELAGGTAVVTRLERTPSSPCGAAELARLTADPFVHGANSSRPLRGTRLLFAHGALKTRPPPSCIANDVRWMASGPRSGLARSSSRERTGSSSMPGRSTPDPDEAMTMVASQVMARRRSSTWDRVVNFELNVHETPDHPQRLDTSG